MVNRIAAGEIIVGPSNALKEMLENSVDAGANSIEINVKDGGLRSLQITDNGSGIDKNDFDLLCQRHATSKLQTFDDLSALTTYGFRGEALASISYVSKLTVISKQKDSPVAYRANFSNGELHKSSLKPIAGKNGTKFIVEDLFYNNPARAKSFRSASDEYSKILDVVGKYAIHCDGVAFFCKKQGDAHPSLAIQAHISTKERIRSFYGSAIANELLDLKLDSSSSRFEEAVSYGLESVEGLITNANYSSKKSTPYVFFINHRLVTCEPLRRSIASVFQQFLPKGGYPFVYLSLLIKPQNLDVNIHPTKREVRFLHDDEIISLISDEIQSVLEKVDHSRSYQVQTVLPVSLSSTRGYLPSSTGLPVKRVYPQHMVRTDPKQQKLQAVPVSKWKELEATALESQDKESNESTAPERQQKEFKATKLHSIKSLQNQVEAETLPAFTKIFENCSFVGIADYTRRLVAVQYDIKLLLMDYGALCNYLFFQIGITDFGNFGHIEFKSDDLYIRDLIQLAVSEEELDTDFVDRTVDKLVSMRDMLEDYFSILITEDGVIKSLPLFLNNYNPPMAKLPLLLYNLGTLVDWTDEFNCLSSILNELSLFYCPLPLDERSSSSEQLKEMDSTIEHIIIPAWRNRLIATNSMKQYIVEIANLPGLYRVFERC